MDDALSRKSMQRSIQKIQAMIPFIKIQAKDHYDFGLQLGKRLKKQINSTNLLKPNPKAPAPDQRVPIKKYKNRCRYCGRFICKANPKLLKMAKMKKGRRCENCKNVQEG